MKFKVFLIGAIAALIAPGYASLADEPLAGSVNKSAIEESILCPTKNETARISYNNGLRLSGQGKPAKAMQEYQKAIELDANYCDAMDNLGQLLRSQGKLDEAIYWYKRSINLVPGNRAAHTDLAVAYRFQGEFDAAISEYQIVLKMNPRDPEGYYGLGTVYFASKDLSAKIPPEVAQKAGI